MFKHKLAHSAIARRSACIVSLFVASVAAQTGAAQATPQPAFDVATIRPSSEEVKFERNGKTEVAYGTLRMRDVSVATCIQWAYGTPFVLIEGPDSLKAVHYDIVAKTDANVTDQQMRMMMRTLLNERFKLKFHAEIRELRVYTLVVSKGGMKMHPATPGGELFRENSATGMVARSISMHELADYLSDPLQAPLADGTALPGRYDFVLDFTPYVDLQQTDIRADAAAVLGPALKGELGLELTREKQPVQITVVDHVEPPSVN
jgi:uncharacterized protein (TIGR03435 family)